MTDNVEVTAGSGTTFATDDVGGVHYQKVKLAIGASDTAVLISPGAGNVDTGTQRITLAADDPAVARLGATNETMPLTDTAAAAINGRLQRIATNVSDLNDLIGEVAHDEVDSGNPSKIGGYASAAVPTAVAAADRVNGWFTLNGALAASPQPHTHGGLTIFRSLDLDETEEEVKGTAGCLYKLRITNRTTSARYVKLYNATAASVTVGGTTPIDTIVVPGGGSADLATVITESFGGMGLAFSTALSMAATTGLADADTGAPGANDVVVTAYYK
jgi:hypothetical protein